MHDLIIVGAGPAGLSAAVYAKRAALDALVLEQSPISGGQVLNTYEVDNYLGLPGISGYDMSVRFREHADKLECEFTEAAAEGLDIICGTVSEGGADLQAAGQERRCSFRIRTDLGEFEARSVILAPGAVHAKLGVPGEEELTGAGVSYCATCDGAFFRGKTVAVIGGGDVAVEDAIYLAKICKKVCLIHRRDELRAAAMLQTALKALDNVEIVWDTVVEAIQGEGQVSRLDVRNVKSDKVSVLDVDGVFIAVGLIPNTDSFRDTVPCDDQGYLIAGEDCATQVPGIFAAGDVRTKKVRQIITAVADGACAVAGVQRYLAD